MKLSDFQINSIEFTHDQALEFKQRVIDGIEDHGLENFEVVQEFPLEKKEDDIFTIYVKCMMETEYKGSFLSSDMPPEPEVIKSRKVHELIIAITNNVGDAVNFSVLGERFFNETFNRMQTMTPIDIEEQIKKHFTI